MDPESGNKSLLFEIGYPEILKNENSEVSEPKYRFMSTYEQRKEPVDPKYQYLLFAAAPYETIAFKIPSLKIDYDEGKFFEQWDKNERKYTL